MQTCFFTFVLYCPQPLGRCGLLAVCGLLGTRKHSRRLDLCSQSQSALPLQNWRSLFTSPHCPSKTGSQVFSFLAPDMCTCMQRTHSWEKTLLLYWRQQEGAPSSGTAAVLGVHGQYLPCSDRSSSPGRTTGTPPLHVCHPRGSWANSWDLLHASYQLYSAGYKALKVYST